MAVEPVPVFRESFDVDPTITRYVWFPGNILSVRRLQETKDMVGVGLPLYITRAGGDEHGSPCLLRTKGFIPRAFITPVEVAAYWTPSELVAPGTFTYAGLTTDGAGGNTQTGFVGGAKSVLVGERRTPGEALHNILTASQNDQGMRRGAVELTALRGVEMAERDRVQAIFTPSYPELPVTLREIEEVVRGVRPDSALIAQTREEMLASCEEFRQWALTRVATEHALVKLGTVGEGYTYTYSDLGRTLMDQLEITPTDQQFQTVAKMQEQIGQSMLAMTQANRGADNTALLEMLAANQAKLTEALAALAARDAAPAPTKASKKQPE